MTELDKQIRDTLTKDDDDFLRELEAEETLANQLLGTFRGPMAKVTWFAMALIAAFTLLMIWTGWNAFHADTDQATTLWVGGFIASLIPHGFLRLWFFQRANHLMILRELKRVELQIVRLVEKGNRP